MAMSFRGQRPDFNLTPPQLTGGGNNNPSAAAGVVKVSDTYGSLRESSPRWDALAADSMKNRSNERQTGMQAEAQVTGQGLASFGQVQSANIQGQYNLAAAKEQASAQKSAAGMQAMGSIASAALGLFSDERLKRDVNAIEDAISVLKKTRPVSYYYKQRNGLNPERLHHGFIAQELQTVLPNAVYTEDVNGMLKVDLFDLIGLLTRAVQQLDERLEKVEGNSHIWRF